MSDAKPGKGCDNCNRSGLSLLLLRPCPVPVDPHMVLNGVDKMNADALVEGLVPSAKPAKVRYVLRLLREGYVHVYLPTPPAGVKPWHVYRVSPAGDLIAATDPLFTVNPQPPSCMRDGHNVSGKKLLPIPKAHEIKTLWIAFSANLWSDTLKAQNAANADAMQKVELSTLGPNEFKPTVDTLKRHVLEFAMGKLRVRDTLASETEDFVSPFPYTVMTGYDEIMPATVQAAAAGHPRTHGKGKAIVLRDPAGVTAELNALRQHRQRVALRAMEAERAKPENVHPLCSSEALMALQQFSLDKSLADAEHQLLGGVMSKEQFDVWARTEYRPSAARSKNPENQPYWEPLEDTPENVKLYGRGMGRRIIPGLAEETRARAWRSAESSWATMQSKYYDEAARQKWVNDFDAHLKLNFIDHVARYEDDWWAARQDAQFNNYFALHFDESDPNNPLAHHSPGVVYSEEVSRALTPAPATSGAVLDAYNAERNMPATDKRAVMLRSLVCNQGVLMPVLQAVIDTELSVASAFAQSKEVQQTKDGLVTYLNKERSDKLYDLGKGVITLSLDSKNPNAAQKAIAKYSWLSAALGDRVSIYALGICTSMSMASAAISAVRWSTRGVQTAWGQAALKWVMNAQLAQRALDLALGAVTRSGPGIATPLLISVSYPLQDATTFLRARGELSNRQIRHGSKDQMIKLHLLTDTEELAKHGGNVKAAIDAGAGKVTLAGVANKAASGDMPKLISQSAFEDLWRNRSNKAAQFFKEGAADAYSSLRTLDGRLAVGGLMINLFGLKKSLGEFVGGVQPVDGTPEAKLEAERKRTNQWLGLLDASGGTMGAAVELMGFLRKDRIVAAGGEAAVEVSSKLAAYRLAGALFGTLGGGLAAIGAMRKRTDAQRAGQNDVAAFYFLSAGSFFGTFLISGFSVSVSFAEWVVKSQTQGVAGRVALRVFGRKALERMTTRFAAQGALLAFGLTIPGIGWIALGLGVGFEVVAVWLTPTPVQNWVSRTYFGRSTAVDVENRPFTKGDWKSEQEALKKLFEPPPAPAKA